MNATWSLHCVPWLVTSTSNPIEPPGPGSDTVGAEARAIEQKFQGAGKNRVTRPERREKDDRISSVRLQQGVSSPEQHLWDREQQQLSSSAKHTRQHGMVGQGQREETDRGTSELDPDAEGGEAGVRGVPEGGVETVRRVCAGVPQV